jgi:hypothetical protein
MAKAKAESTSITWRSLAEACARVAEVFGSLEYAEKWIIAKRKAGHIGSRAAARDPPDLTDDEFWGGTNITLNRADGSATAEVVIKADPAPAPVAPYRIQFPAPVRFAPVAQYVNNLQLSGPIGFSHVAQYGIQFAGQDIEARLPGGGRSVAAPARPPSSGKKDWFDGAKKRHPRLPDESKAAYARRLAPIMQADLGPRAWKETSILRRLCAK